MYDEFNAPKRLQDRMLSVELKWHTNEQVSVSMGLDVKSDDRSSDLISDYKPAPFFFTRLTRQSVHSIHSMPGHIQANSLFLFWLCYIHERLNTFECVSFWKHPLAA